MRHATDQLVVNGRVEDRSQQPVALGRLVTAGVDRDLRGPAAHDRRRDLGERVLPDGRLDVPAEQPAVALLRHRREWLAVDRPGLEPSLGEVSELLPPASRVDNLAAELLALDLPDAVVGVLGRLNVSSTARPPARYRTS